MQNPRDLRGAHRVRRIFTGKRTLSPQVLGAVPVRRVRFPDPQTPGETLATRTLSPGGNGRRSPPATWRDAGSGGGRACLPPAHTTPLREGRKTPALPDNRITSDNLPHPFSLDNWDLPPDTARTIGSSGLRPSAATGPGKTAAAAGVVSRWGRSRRRRPHHVRHLAERALSTWGGGKSPQSPSAGRAVSATVSGPALTGSRVVASPRTSP